MTYSFINIKLKYSVIFRIYECTYIIRRKDCAYMDELHEHNFCLFKRE